LRDRGARRTVIKTTARNRENDVRGPCAPRRI
jgi:hypothetical protein